MRPQTDQDWTIQSMTIHGAFFERWCEKVINDSMEWTVRTTNYPVEFPPPNGPLRGEESALDIWAEKRIGQAQISLLIECKKNNPDFVNWVFLPKQSKSNTHVIYIPVIETVPSDDPHPKGWAVATHITHFQTNRPVANEARETRGDYLKYKREDDKTKTANKAINDASHQVALATQAIFQEEDRFCRVWSSGNKFPVDMWRGHYFIPTIVTTARLFICDFEPLDVNPTTGEIPFEKATLKEQSSLFYEYALPKHLQHQTTSEGMATMSNRGARERLVRMPILIIHSSKLVELLTELSRPDRIFNAKNAT